jgi:hypothetical protein
MPKKQTKHLERIACIILRIIAGPLLRTLDKVYDLAYIPVDIYYPKGTSIQSVMRRKNARALAKQLHGDPRAAQFVSPILKRRHSNVQAITNPWLEFESNNYSFASLPREHFLSFPISIPSQRKTLVLDLDETLIHSSVNMSRNYDYMLEAFIDKIACLYYVHKRPYVDFFLNTVN